MPLNFVYSRPKTVFSVYAKTSIFSWQRFFMYDDIYMYVCIFVEQICMRMHYTDWRIMFCLCHNTAYHIHVRSHA